LATLASTTQHLSRLLAYGQKVEIGENISGDTLWAKSKKRKKISLAILRGQK